MSNLPHRQHQTPRQRSSDLPQNRVDPFGALHFSPARGTLMGNRGGRFHDAEQKLGARRWASKAWIICLCDFKNRQRQVWGDGYTELFFLDEVTALSAGHRPCFECRRSDAVAFKIAFGATSAPDMDNILHQQRLGARQMLPIEALPDGVMIAHGGAAFVLRGRAMLRWSFGGYVGAQPRPGGLAEVLTPPGTVAALRHYTPQFHPSAATF